MSLWLSRGGGAIEIQVYAHIDAAWAPIDQFYFGLTTASKLIDFGLEGHMKWLPGGREMVEPFSSPKCHGANLCTVLRESHGEVTAVCAHCAGRFRKPYIRRAENRSAIAVAKRRQLFQLANGVERESGKRGFSIDQNLCLPQRLRQAFIDNSDKCLAKGINL